jgi:hypothetical protein
LLKWNSFSSSVSCFVVKFVRPVLLLLAAAAMLPGTVRLGDAVQLTKFGLPAGACPLYGKAGSAAGLFATNSSSGRETKERIRRRVSQCLVFVFVLLANGCPLYSFYSLFAELS